MFLDSLENHKQVIEQGRRGRGAKGAMAPPIRAKSVDFSENFCDFSTFSEIVQYLIPFLEIFRVKPTLKLRSHVAPVIEVY